MMIDKCGKLFSVFRKDIFKCYRSNTSFKMKSTFILNNAPLHPETIAHHIKKITKKILN